MKKISKIVILLLFVVLVFTLSSCSSTDKTATAGIDTNYNVICAYNATEDTTSVKVPVNVNNGSIYNITKCSFKFDIYKDGELVRTTEYADFDLSVSHGSSKTTNLSFTAKGEVTDVKINVWSADFSSLWSTYQIWFILTIIISAVVALIAVIAIIATEADFEDIIEFVEDKFYLIFIIAIPFIPYVIDGFSSGVWSWVPIVIILGGILSVIVLTVVAVLIIYLIMYIIEQREFGMDYADDTGEPAIVDEDGNEYTIDDVLDDKDSLMVFSKENLCDWCRSNGITGYSKLNKAELVSLIMQSKKSNNKNIEESKDNSKKQSSTPKSSNKKNGIRFDDIAGLDAAKEAFKEKVILPFEHPEIFEKFGKKAGGGILLYGLPGTGKTMFAEAASNELDALFISVKCSDIKSKWYGESEQNIKNVFDKARKAKRAIIFFDEFEAIGAKRTDNSENGNNDLVPEILAEMQGVGTNNSDCTIMVIAAKNKPWAIDSAFLRPGRFDEKIYIPLPDYESRKKLFELQLSKLPVADDLDYDYLAKITEGFNGADIKEVCEKLKMSAIKDSLSKGSEQTIGMDDVERIESSIRSSVSLEDIERLKEFENK